MYAVIVEWSKRDHSFIATVPKLPGCKADGETRQETLAVVEIVIAQWIDTAKELGCALPCVRIGYEQR